jgi:hypothetical protein
VNDGELPGVGDGEGVLDGVHRRSANSEGSSGCSIASSRRGERRLEAGDGVGVLRLDEEGLDSLQIGAHQVDQETRQVMANRIGKRGRTRVHR